MKSISFPSPSSFKNAPASEVSASVVGVGGAGASEIRALRSTLPDIYFVNTPPERVNRHIEILRQLGDSLDVDSGDQARIIDFHRAPGRALDECTFCAFDEGEPGLLAKMCGLMLWLNLRVHTAFIYTLDTGSEVLREGARPIALDTFLISERHFGIDRALSHKTQNRLKQEIDGFFNGAEIASDWLSRARRRMLSPVQIHALRLENFAHDVSTRLTLSAAHDDGILYRITKSLSQVKLNIRAAQISTHDSTSNDIFFLSDIHGQRLDDAQLPTLTAQLRALMETPMAFGPGDS